ncbi:hypothetical protein DL98DRAFT_248384 [Cadophora sp. DSE1049]|nr:hypothetical protein DL98DRAFT_248384 [Cadophora sp. DSE1049]
MIGFIIIIFFVLWLCDVPVTPWFWTYWRRMTNWWPTKATNKDSKDQARRRRTFLAKNACLLSSGEFSDVTVTCSGQTWNLHRAVICPRCRYFQNAFSGKFQVHTVLRNLGSWVTLTPVLGGRDWIGGVG